MRDCLTWVDKAEPEAKGLAPKGYGSQYCRLLTAQYALVPCQLGSGIGQVYELLEGRA